MSSFKFPPPPPAPPKAATSNAQSNQSNNRGGSSRGRGDRNERGGRGRGGGQGSFGNNNRGGYIQGNARGRGSHQNNRGHARGGFNSGYGQQQHEAQMNHQNTSQTFPGTYSNSAPSAVVQSPQPMVDPAAFAQAMSFMATPAGAQTMAAFASHMATTSGFSGNGGAQTAPTPFAQSPSQYSPQQHAGQKRKWEDRGHGQTKPQLPHRTQQSSKPPRAKAAVAPAVPSFGFSLPQSVSAAPGQSSKFNKHHDNRKGKVRLGLANQQPLEESSAEEDDADEESALAARIKGGGYAFEHNGEHISLQSAADIAAWIKDRRQHFPTQQRIIEKAEAAAEKRRNELDFIRKLKGKQPRPESADNMQSERSSKEQEMSKKDEKKREELAALRKKLHESMEKKRTEPPAPVNLGIGYATDTDSNDESSVLSESSVVSSLEDSSDESDSDESDSDAAPEVTSSKAAPPPVTVPPPPTTAEQKVKPDKDKICQKFKRYGKCPFGHSCKFKHPVVEVKRVSLYEKLVEQELVKADELALQAIKFLGQNGYLG